MGFGFFLVLVRACPSLSELVRELVRACPRGCPSLLTELNQVNVVNVASLVPSRPCISGYVLRMCFRQTAPHASQVYGSYEGLKVDEGVDEGVAGEWSFSRRVGAACTKNHWVYDRTRRRRRFGRRRGRDCLIMMRPTEVESSTFLAASKCKLKRLRSFRSERSIRKQKYVARKCRRRTRSLRTPTRTRPNRTQGPPPRAFSSVVAASPSLSLPQSRTSGCVVFKRVSASCYSSVKFALFFLILFTLVTQSTCIRMTLSAKTSHKSYTENLFNSPPSARDDIVNGAHRVRAALWVLFLCSILATSSFAVKRVSQRAFAPNKRHADMVDPNSVSSKDWLGSPRYRESQGQQRARVEKLKKGRANNNSTAKERQEKRRDKAAQNALFQRNKKQRFVIDCENDAHEAKEKENARLNEEIDLPLSTRDVKHFSESMHDECDMEPCRVCLFNGNCMYLVL